jgi:hypothetical protein
VAAQRLLPFAEEDFEREAAAKQPEGDQFVAEALRRIGRQCRQFAELDRIEEFGDEEGVRIREEVGDWTDTEVWVRELDHSSAALHAVVSEMEAVGGKAMRVLAALDAHEHNLDEWHIWMTPFRAMLMLAIVVAVARYSLLPGLVLAAAWIVWLGMLRAKSRGTQAQLAAQVSELADSAREFTGRLRKAERRAAV